MLTFKYSKISRTKSELMRLRKVEKCLMIMMISAAIALPVVALSQYLGPTERAIYTSITDVLADPVDDRQKTLVRITGDVDDELTYAD